MPQTSERDRESLNGDVHRRASRIGDAIGDTARIPCRGDLVPLRGESSGARSGCVQRIAAVVRVTVFLPASLHGAILAGELDAADGVRVGLGK